MEKLTSALNSNLLSVFWFDGKNFFGPVEIRDSENSDNHGGVLGMKEDHLDI